MKIKHSMILLCFTLLIGGCTKETMPEITPTQTMDTYLAALKNQNTIEMAKYTQSGKADDFRMSEEESVALGLSVDTAKKFTDIILRFDYTLANEQIQEEEQRASVDVQIKTYDMLQVLESTAEAKKEDFEEIYGQEISDAKKNEQISTILLDGFAHADKTYEATITLHMVVQDGVWKISDTTDELYTKLFNTAFAS